MLVLKRKTKKFAIVSGTAQVLKEMENLPNENECFKFISDGGFSSICFINAISKKSKINNLYISTFAVGKKEMLALKSLSDNGNLGQVFFLLQKQLLDNKDGYAELFEAIIKQKGWHYSDLPNHNKVLLFDTNAGKFVIETSSNLNKNPRIEQFSVEKDENLYNFYLKNLFEKVITT